MPDSVRLRPHHLLCMLTYLGKGYTPTFIKNFDALATRIASGEMIQVVHGPDDVCAPLHSGIPGYHCVDGEISLRDTFATQDLEALLDIGLRKNMRLQVDAERLTQMRQAFQAGTIRRACKKCLWDNVCTEVAQNAFQAPDLRLGRMIPIIAV